MDTGIYDIPFAANDQNIFILFFGSRQALPHNNLRLVGL
jgi:hypothetical protein